MVTWVKKTKNNKLFYGTGVHFRNATEQLLIFQRKGERALRLSSRNVLFARSGKNTIKPKQEERKLFDALKQKKLNKFAYIFSGTSISKFVDLDIDLCDLKNLEIQVKQEDDWTSNFY